LPVYAWTYLWALNSVPLVYVSSTRIFKNFKILQCQQLEVC